MIVDKILCLEYLTFKHGCKVRCIQIPRALKLLNRFSFIAFRKAFHAFVDELPDDEDKNNSRSDPTPTENLRVPFSVYMEE